MYFAKSVWIKSDGEKNNFFAVLAMSALRRLRVQSNLLDRIAFEVLPLVVCTNGPCKKTCRLFTPSASYFLGIADPVLLEHAALL